MSYIGRMDQQVKVRGYRVELGEIEAAIMQHSTVKQCAVLVREDDATGKRLVAYVVYTEGGSVSVAEMREHLRAKLPEYMIPSTFMGLSHLPMTANGKLDRKALPAPGIEQSATEEDQARTPVEEILCSIWADVLKVEGVGRQQDFFELGGHSLLATQVISRVREAFDVEVGLKALFESPTVAGLAEAVERERGAGRRVEESPIVAVSRERELPLSFAQLRLWFIHQLEPDSPAYNVLRAVHLRGELNISALTQGLWEIARRHEVLRTRFEVRDGEPVQIISEPCEVDLPVRDISNVVEGEREKLGHQIAEREAARPFDLGQGPVWRAALIRMGAEEHVLLLSLHHVASDGWSTGVLVKEFCELYEAHRRGVIAALSELPVQYADFAVWQRERLKDGVINEQLHYWVKHLEAAPELLRLPYDKKRPKVQSFAGGTHAFTLDEKLTSRATDLCRAEGVTLFMPLLAAWQTLLYRYSGQEDICVGTPIANRNRAETEGLIGFFINTLVMRVDLRGNPPFREVLKRVRRVALDAYANQDVPFEKIVEELQPERSLSRAPLFHVWFTLGNVPMSEFKMAD